MAEADPYDLDAAAAAKQKQKDIDDFERRVEVDDLKWLMGHKQGRRYVNRQLKRYGVFRSVFSDQALLMAFQEGNRNNGLKLMADIHEHCPERYVEMVNEAKADVERASRSRSNDAGN